MENVVAFNSELSSLYDSKPPISKAKMASITRAAMKAIKFYKHVVQSVEKFILKCKPEYKVPGLYVIDSIVRQSRHQFGAEKDVFAPRFARNMKQTFANLFRCASDDKSRIIRVLNLWQKNNVFAPEVIQPLFDLADPNHPIYQQTSELSQDLSSIPNGLNISGQDINTSNISNITEDSHLHAQPSEISMSHQTSNALDQNTIRQLQQLQQILIRQTNEGSATTSAGGSTQSDSIKFNKKVLDYDYGEDDEDEKSASPHISNILDTKNLTQLLKDPNVLRQLQTLQKLKEQEEKQSKLKEMRIQEEAFEKHVQNVLKGSSGSASNLINESFVGPPDKNTNNANDVPVIEVINLEDGNDSRSTSPDRERYNKRRRNSRSRSRDRGRDRDRRRRSKSRSRSRSPRSNRRRGSSRERERSTKDKEKEKEKEKEYERERRRKGLPDIKREHLTVCSNTLWVGHLSKLVHQEELSDTFGKYGDIISIDMIYPRGCAFIVMNRRQDAFKAMQNLKNHKLQGRAITISWAAGKGVKSKEWKDYWDLDVGVSYIPWSKLDKNTDLEALEEGGMFDEDTMPGWMKEKINQKKDTQENKPQGIFGVDGVSVDTSQPPPTTGSMIPGVPLIPPYSPMGPVPRMMPPPLGVPMAGNMVPGLPMAPNMVPSMPPPHMMMPPPAGMVPQFTPMPGPIDKSIPPSATGPSSEVPPTSIPPSYMGPNIGNMHIPPHMVAPQQAGFGGMGIPTQFQSPLSQSIPSGNTNQGDDHMDIEMEDENPPIVNKLSGGQSAPPVVFNQPPPIFSTFPNEMPTNLGVNENQRIERECQGGTNEDRRDIEFERGSRNRDIREKNNDFGKRDKEQNRWGSSNTPIVDRDLQIRDREKMNNLRDFNRSNGSSQQEQGRPIPSIWQDSGANFQPQIFGDGQRRGPMDINLPTLDVNAQQHLQRLQHFEMRRNNDFVGDDRRGVPQQQRDFFPNINSMNVPNIGNIGNIGSIGNMSNRFGPPPQGLNRNTPMPLRSPFGPRLGPMFVRGPPGRPGPPGFNFNDRPPFEREDGRGGRARNNDMQNRRTGRNNRRDDEDNRRGNTGSGGGGARFQNRDRDTLNDRPNRDKNDRDNGRDRDRGGGSGGGSGRDRNRGDREKGDNRGGRDRNNERDGHKDRKSDNYRDNKDLESKPSVDIPQTTILQDTEEDWDKELSEHSIEQNFNAEQTENLETWDSADENAFDNPADGQDVRSREFKIETDQQHHVDFADSLMMEENIEKDNMQCSDNTNILNESSGNEMSSNYIDENVENQINENVG